MTKFKTIDGTTYAYTIEGAGEPLVLLHGFTGTRATWDDLKRVASSTYRILTIDLPGHGQTVAKQKVTMDEFVNHFYLLTRDLGLDRFHLLGYSLGGRTALSYAMQYPETIRSLILESASPGLKTEKERQERRANDQRLAEMMIEKGLKDFVLYWENLPLFESQKKLDRSIKMAIRKERLSQSAIGLAQSLLGMGTGAQRSWWDQLSSIRFPLHLIVGSLDSKFIALNKAMAEEVSTSKLSIVEGAGHAVHLEQKSQFAKIVMDYIDKI